MRRLFRDMNPTLRGFLLIALAVAVIFVLQLQATLVSLFLLAQIAFFLAIAFFIFLLWRERRAEIATWSERARAVFYGAALLIVADLGAYFLVRPSGPDALAFLLVLGLAGFAMFRVWRDERTYSL